MTRLSGFVAILGMLAVLGPAQASPVYSGQFTATWSDPVLSGDTIDGMTGVPSFRDNSAGAACSIAGCPVGVGFTPGSTTLAWGISPTSSTLNFDGHFFIGVAPDTVFDMGRVTFFNGTSDLSTIIFGATLNLTYVPCSFCGPTGPVDALNIAVPIVTTANTGTNLQNADWVGPFGTSKPLTFNVLEGFSADAELYGKIVGDPQFVPTLLVTDDPNAFIGNGQPVGLPEPASLGLVMSAFAAFGFAGARSRRSRNT
jgi:hypothetical protein